MALMVVKVSWVYVYPQTHQTVHIKYVQLFTRQSYFNKVILKILAQSTHRQAKPSAFLSEY